jgi:hypothetical protein
MFYLDFPVTDDIESALAERYNTVIDLMECGGYFPTYAECVEAATDQFSKACVTRRIEAALHALFMPGANRNELRVFLQQWDGMAETLVTKLEELAGTLRQAQSDYAELIHIVIA